MEESAAKVNVWLVVWLYVLLLAPQAQSLPADETKVCDVVAVVAVEQSPRGVYLTVALASTDSTESVVVSELPGATLPQPECGPDHSRCLPTCRVKGSGYICAFPVRNGTENFLALVEFGRLLDQASFREEETKLLSPEAGCVPLAVFDGGPAVPIENLVPCLDITSGDPYLYFESLVESTASLANSTIQGDSRVSGKYIEIPGRDVSSLLYRNGASGSTACSPPDNVFMMIDSRVVVFRLFTEHAVFHHPTTKIDDCSGVRNIEFFEPDYLRLQCSPTDVVIYDPCSTENIVERRDLTVNATVFQCPDADLNVYHFEGHLKFEAYGSAVPSHPFGGFKLPFNDTTTGRCVGARSPVLLLARGSGETYLLELSSGNLQFVAVDTCGPNVCLDVSVLKTGRSSFAGVFDYSNNTYVVIDLRCPKSPVVSRVYYNTHRPARLALAAIGNTRHCSPCSMSTPPHPETTTTTENTTSSQDTSVESGGNNLAASNTGALIGAGAGGGVVVVVLAVVMVLLAVIVIVQSRPCEHLRLPSAPSTSGDTELSSLPEHPVPQIPGDVTVNESVRVSSQAVAQEDRRAMVPPADTADRTRFTHTEVHDNYHKRTQNENDSNNFEQKRRAFASAP
jgi:hypothetical protein